MAIYIAEFKTGKKEKIGIVCKTIAQAKNMLYDYSDMSKITARIYRLNDEGQRVEIIALKELSDIDWQFIKWGLL
jgi:hypothetical protein